jgi:hypothetical protein
MDDELTPTNEQEKGAAAPSVTVPEDVMQNALEASIGPVMGQVGGALRNMDARLEAIEQRGMQQEQPTHSGGGDTLTDSKLEKLLADPDAYVREQAGKLLSEKVAPILEHTLGSQQGAALVSIQNEFNAEFGEGSWDKYIANDLAPILEKFPVAIRGSEQHIRSAVDGLKGGLFNELIEAKASVAKERNKEAERSATGDYTPLGSGRPIPVAGKLTPDDKAFIAMIRERDDPSFSEEDFINMMSGGNTENDWNHKGKK